MGLFICVTIWMPGRTDLEHLQSAQQPSQSICFLLFRLQGQICSEPQLNVRNGRWFSVVGRWGEVSHDNPGHRQRRPSREALLRTLSRRGAPVRGLDLKPSPFTDAVGSIVDPGFVRRQMHGVTAIIHSATLHKPHVATHTNQQFIDTNVSGTLNLLEAAAAAGVTSFVFTSTTSAFGSQLRPEADRPRYGSPRSCRRCPKTSTAPPS